ncbi:MAG: N-acetylmuramoyl-L-alanine amidase [Coriobacteriia bacterium]|nr:N-acetylmuramoyl-L-alanine amidase [Coriobacteriia bacterium]
MGKRSRAERLVKVRGRRKRIALVAGAAAVVVLAIGGVLVGSALRTSAEPVSAEPETIMLAADASPTATRSALTSESVLPVEVPPLTGMPVDEATVLLEAVGLAVTRVGTPAGELTPGLVIDQSPEPGERLTAGSVVTLTFADPEAVVSTATPRPAGPVVCIDPGHQATADTDPEPVGPGAAETKAKVSGGGTGVTTGVREHELNLVISLKVKERLERYGVTVVMTRTTANVDISNSQRAQVANNARADLFLRIHADSSTNASVSGVSTLYPGGNDWVAPIRLRSLRAAGLIQREVLASTGATDRSLAERADIAGFNWATVPSVLVETGFLSNPAEDKKLAEEAYQDKIADGIARGVLRYLGVTE